jgi:hypothetical protein
MGVELSARPSASWPGGIPFRPGAAPESLPAIATQLTDLRSLRGDAAERGWDSEVARHNRVIDSLESHVRRLENPT